MPSPADPYTVLGLVPPCSPAAVRKAYLQAALACHPDRHPDDAAATAKFQAVSQAYRALQSDSDDEAHGDAYDTAYDTGAHAGVDVDLDLYKAMFERMAHKARTLWEAHQPEIAAAQTLWQSFKARVTGPTTDWLGSDSEDEGEVTSDDDDGDGDEQHATATTTALPKAPPLLLTITTTPTARQAKDIHKVAYTRYRWDAHEGRAVAEQYAVLVPVEHEEVTFAGEGDWMVPETVPGDVVVFVEGGRG